MTAFRRFGWDSPEYSDAFGCLLRCSDERAHLVPVLERQLDGVSAAAAALDWGAGIGDLTRLLARRCPTTFAVEPSASMRAVLRRRLPGVALLEGDVRTATPPVPIDFALLAHVLYHLPDREWLALVARILGTVRLGGRLTVVMKSGPSGCRDMLEQFGAQGFDLERRLEPLAAAPLVASVRRATLTATIATASYAETEQIARFMMCDRLPGEFAAPPQEEAFVDYVRGRLWDEGRGRGGWRYQASIWTVERG